MPVERASAICSGHLRQRPLRVLSRWRPRRETSLAATAVFPLIKVVSKLPLCWKDHTLFQGDGGGEARRSDRFYRSKCGTYLRFCDRSL